MSLHDFLVAVRKHWVLVLAPVLVLCGVIGYLSAQATPLYRSSATVYVTLSSSGSATDLNQGADYTQAQMLSFAELASLPIVLQPVIDELGLDVTAKSLAERVSASTTSGTSLLTVSVVAAEPERAAVIANSVADHLTTVVKDLAPVNDSGRATINATIVKDAVPAAYAFSPNTKRNLLAAGFAGLLLGLVLAYLRDVLDTRVRTPQDVEAAIGVPVLGSVRAVRRPTPFSMVEVDSAGAQAEEFRRIRTNMQMIGRVGVPKVFVVSSAIAGEGKSHTSLRVAAALAAAGDRVLLVEADLRRPSLADSVGLEGGVGLTDILVGRATFDDVVQDLGPRLGILLSGAVPPNPSELLASKEFGDLVELGQERYDVVLVDAPPLLPVADAVVISRSASGLLLVVDASRVRRAQIQRAAESVRIGGGRIIGVVLNRAKVASDEASYYVADAKRRRRDQRPSGPRSAGGPLSDVAPAAVTQSDGSASEPQAKASAPQVEPADDGHSGVGEKSAEPATDGPSSPAAQPAQEGVEEEGQSSSADVTPPSGEAEDHPAASGNSPEDRMSEMSGTA